jgi:hypothetical protein
MLARSVSALGAVIAAAALLMAIALIWLVLEDPVAVAGVADGGGSQAVIAALMDVIVQALERIVRCL